MIVKRHSFVSKVISSLFFAIAVFSVHSTASAYGICSLSPSPSGSLFTFDPISENRVVATYPYTDSDGVYRDHLTNTKAFNLNAGTYNITLQSADLGHPGGATQSFEMWYAIFSGPGGDLPTPASNDIPDASQYNETVISNFNIPDITSITGVHARYLDPDDPVNNTHSVSPICILFEPAAVSTPALSAAPANAAPGGVVTVSWQDVSGAMVMDWVGLYFPGAANGDYLDWFYTSSCTKFTGGTALSAGSCEYAMPTAPGTYEFRLFPNNGYSPLLATSDNVTVDPSSAAGNIIVNATLDGDPWSSGGSLVIDYSLSGPSGDISNDTVSYTYQNVTAEEIYTLNYISGGPSGAILSSIDPISSQFLPENGTIQFTFNFSSSICGNGIVESGEDCDGSNLNGATCQSLGGTGGSLSCSPTCEYDTSQCVFPPPAVCGNAITETGEDCDAGQYNTNAWWKFDEGSGSNTSDSSGNGNTGTINGATWTVGFGNALDFNGNDVVTAQASPSIANIFAGGGTVSAWIYPRSIPSGVQARRIIEKSSWSYMGGSSNGWALAVCNNHANTCPGYTNVLRFKRDFSTPAFESWITPNNSITLNAWHHVAVVYDDSSSSNQPFLYIDGEVQTIPVLNPTGTALDESAIPLRIGNTMFLDRGFDGVIDDVRMYDRKLTALEIENIYGDGLNGATCQSLGYLGGTLKCSAVCTYDVTQCISAPSSQCSDGSDNDGDLQADYPNDVGCTSASDDNEANQCSDGFDNDGDGLIDNADPGCHLDGNPGNPPSYFPQGNFESNQLFKEI